MTAGWGAPIGVVAAGAGLFAWGACHPASQLFGPTTRHVAPGTVALTFDDGPNPAITPGLLDLLDRHGARATFFLIGRFVEAEPGLAAEIAARGHRLGNHTATHPSLIWRTPARIADEIGRCQDAIERATGRRPEWLRPPYGFRGPHLQAVARRMGIRGIAMWSVTGYDWTPQPAGRMARRLSRVGGRDIVLLHDGWHGGLGADRRHTVDALAYWLPRWVDRGLGLAAMPGTSEIEGGRS
ncbi:MAG: polysaccharide deacetylase family protein [Acidobacteriota bacterium]|nr:polysaccharide deacetylase family protein [Acidobacteriota bacterium]